MISLRRSLTLWKWSMLSLGVRDIAAIVFVTTLLAGILVAYALHPRPLIQPSSLLSPEWDCATSTTYAEACVKRIGGPK